LKVAQWNFHGKEKGGAECCCRFWLVSPSSYDDTYKHGENGGEQTWESGSHSTLLGSR
jgi:hypothetical protein